MSALQLISNLTDQKPRRDSGATPVRPCIVVKARQMREVAADVLAALASTNDPPSVFVRDGRLCRVKSDGDGAVQVVDLNAYSLRQAAGDTADFFRSNGEATSLPLDICRDILIRSGSLTVLPSLLGLTASPVVTTNGTIEAVPGYLSESKLYFAPPEGDAFEYERLAATRENVERAKDEIFGYLLDGFPFREDASRANSLAYALQPLVRPMISGPTPLFLVEASTRSTGKDLLAETLGSITNPKRISPRSAPTDEAEWKKTITSVLLGGNPHVWLNNLDGFVNSASLHMALTSTKTADRLLGGSKDVSPPNNSTWVATGNNCRLHEDLATRCVYIRLDAHTERPELRDGFKCQYPVQEVTERRGHYLGLLLCIIEYWINQGMPKYGGEPRGRYPAWLSVMGGILETIGVNDIIGNYEERSEAANIDHEHWRHFVVAWGEAYGEKPVTVRGDIVEIAFGTLDERNQIKTPGPLLDVLTGLTARNRPEKLGRALTKNLDRVFDTWQIQKGKMRDGYPTYYLRNIGK